MTIKDIARLSGVSITTVSRVINNHKVGEEIKSRILKIIEKYEYRPNTYAQYLGQRKNAKNITKAESGTRKT